MKPQSSSWARNLAGVILKVAKFSEAGSIAQACSLGHCQLVRDSVRPQYLPMKTMQVAATGRKSLELLPVVSIEYLYHMFGMGWEPTDSSDTRGLQEVRR